MKFEYDPAKSQSNQAKHGINFEEAQVLWPRFMIIAKIKGKHWSAIATLRGTTIRIISVRRSRKSEVSLYEN
jgi:uncharacterized protein